MNDDEIINDNRWKWSLTSVSSLPFKLFSNFFLSNCCTKCIIAIKSSLSLSVALIDWQTPMHSQTLEIQIPQERNHEFEFVESLNGDQIDQNI